MVDNIPRPPTLHRSCKACARGKRRCDQRWPRCSRCLARNMDCEYVNIPLTAETASVEKRLRRPTVQTRPGAQCLLSKSSIQPPLRLEIAKGYDPHIVSFLVEGLRQFPVAFAQNMKTMFIHPEIHEASSSSDTIQDVHALCQFHILAEQEKAPRVIRTALRQKATDLHRQLGQSVNFGQLLSYTQLLLLIHCMLLLGNEDDAYSETTATLLTDLAQHLFQQAPIQLPNTLNPRHAWLFAESVRRTIIIGFMLRSVYSLKKRNYSVRTPFVDSLPFDLRTSLWDGGSAVWENESSSSSNSMVSLHQYSTMLENGQVHGISTFGRLILAACKGKAASGIPFPHHRPYISSN